MISLLKNIASEKTSNVRNFESEKISDIRETPSLVGEIVLKV